MHRHKHGFGWGVGFAPHMFHCGRGWRHPWGFGFPKREDYVEMLKAYKKELEEVQRQIAEELGAVAREIEELEGTPA
jgi:hypothetical protein